MVEYKIHEPTTEQAIRAVCDFTGWCRDGIRLRKWPVVAELPPSGHSRKVKIDALLGLSEQGVSIEAVAATAIENCGCGCLWAHHDAGGGRCRMCECAEYQAKPALTEERRLEILALLRDEKARAQTLPAMLTYSFDTALDGDDQIAIDSLEDCVLRAEVVAQNLSVALRWLKSEPEPDSNATRRMQRAVAGFNEALGFSTDHKEVVASVHGLGEACRFWLEQKAKEPEPEDRPAIDAGK